MHYVDNIPVWGDHEANTLEQAKTCARTADYFALMADGHLGYGVPIGGVIASESRISPTAVGFDIACGNKAVRLDIPASEVRAEHPQASWTTSGTRFPSVSAGATTENNSDSPFIHRRLTKAGRPKLRSR